MTNRGMERERERREWEQSELQDLDDLQAKHARIDERLEVRAEPCLNPELVQSPSTHPELCPEHAMLCRSLHLSDGMVLARLVCGPDCFCEAAD